MASLLMVFLSDAHQYGNNILYMYYRTLFSGARRECRMVPTPTHSQETRLCRASHLDQGLFALEPSSEAAIEVISGISMAALKSENVVREPS